MSDKKYTIDNFDTEKSKKSSFKLFPFIIIAYCRLCLILIFFLANSKDASKNDDGEKSAVIITVEDKSDARIDINSADKDELLRLDGIGTVLADRIIDYRNKNGNFKTIEEIQNVSGIGEIIFERIKEDIYVLSPTYSTDNSCNTSSFDTSSVTSKETEKNSQTKMTTSSSQQASINFPIDLNTASENDLMQIPEISNKCAFQIVDLRRKIGKFSTFEELWMVDSIDARLYNNVIKYVYIQE